MSVGVLLMGMGQVEMVPEGAEWRVGGRGRSVVQWSERGGCDDSCVVDTAWEGRGCLSSVKGSSCKSSCRSDSGARVANSGSMVARRYVDWNLLSG